MYKKEFEMKGDLFMLNILSEKSLEIVLEVEGVENK